MQICSSNTTEVSAELDTLLENEFKDGIKQLGIQNVFRAPEGYVPAYVDPFGSRYLPTLHDFTFRLHDRDTLLADMLEIDVVRRGGENVLQYTDAFIYEFHSGVGSNRKTDRYLMVKLAVYKAKEIYQGETLVAITDEEEHNVSTSTSSA